MGARIHPLVPLISSPNHENIATNALTTDEPNPSNNPLRGIAEHGGRLLIKSDQSLKTYLL